MAIANTLEILQSYTKPSKYAHDLITRCFNDVIPYNDWFTSPLLYWQCGICAATTRQNKNNDFCFDPVPDLALSEMNTVAKSEKTLNEIIQPHPTDGDTAAGLKMLKW